MNTTATPDTIPALTLPLRGRALIEASAGTGKTWTLTGIILRLLLETPTAPRDIIATTFTRKAAAEMQHRVRDRLDTLRERLKTLAAAYAADDHLLDDDDALAARLGAQLDRAGETDPINRHLILAPVQAEGLDGLIHLIRRIEDTHIALDELTIGTLDSICQRWLAENALETGSDEHLHINEHSSADIDTIHDHLRRIRHELAAAHPAAYARLIAGGGLRDSDAYLGAVAAATRNNEAAITPVTPPDAADSAAARAALRDLDPALIADWQTLTDSDALLAATRKDAAWKKHRAALPALIAQLCDNRPLDDACTALAAGILDPKFNKGHDALAARYHDHPLTTLLRAALTHQHDHDTLDAAATAALITAVRAELPAAREQRGETTFNDKITRLNRALEGPHGAALARYLTHRYPVMLVDESQDLNHDQAQLLENTYLREDTAPPHGLLLLVGDPKQAIYGFRGGDVANYNRLKAHIAPADRHQLLTNHRSAANLIAAHNEHYTHNGNDRLGDNIHYHPARAASLKNRIVDCHGDPIAAPLIWMDSGANSNEETDRIAAITAQLLAETSPYARRNDDGSLSRIRPADIQILMRGNNSLLLLQHKLHRHGIDSELRHEQNLFTGSVARAFADLLAAIRDPENSAHHNRLLSGPYYNKTQADLDRLAAIEQGEAKAGDGEYTLADLRAALNRARAQWQTNGLLAALGPLLDHPKHSIWQTLAAAPYPDNHRHLLDLRHIQQLLAERPPEQNPAHYSRWWQRQLADPPQADWAIVPPLPGSDAVRLLTIHKAKGLQAPIVILAPGGSNKGGNRDSGVRLYPVRADGRLSLSPCKPEDAAQQENDRYEDEENRRLHYVGITRAEDLLIIAKRSKNPAKPGEALYRSRAESPHSRELPADATLSQHERVLPAATAETPAAAPNGEAEPWPRKHYYGWQRTSFTALNRDTADNTAVNLADYAAAEPHDGAAAEHPAGADIRYTFPRGPAAGSYLHAILEHTHGDRRAAWRKTLIRHAAEWQIELDDSGLDACEHWLADIYAACCPQSGISLAASKRGACRSEYGFSLALDDRDPANIDRIDALFTACGLPLGLKKNHKHYRYLRGEIDHLYQHENRYYILDYKSNHLGDSPAAYNAAALKQAMDDHHYWLQAAIYQVALHRLLQTRLPDYDPETHLGGVEYLYLRGVNSADRTSGGLGHRYPTGFILALDRELGRPPACQPAPRHP